MTDAVEPRMQSGAPIEHAPHVRVWLADGGWFMFPLSVAEQLEGRLKHGLDCVFTDVYGTRTLILALNVTAAQTRDAVSQQRRHPESYERLQDTGK